MDGLNKQQIEYRINNGMVNNENIKYSRTEKEILKGNIITLFNVINIILFLLVLTTGSIKNATFIISIIVNTCIGIYQELKAKRIIEKLKIANVSKVRVIREGKEQEIKTEEILIDDLLVLKQGDTLAVDAKIIKANSCEVDESIITGESNSIIKKENDNLISGSIIISGYCYAKVTAINRNTYANNLIKEASELKEESSYLKKSINSILKVVTFLILPIGISLFITQLIHGGGTYSESILSSVAGVIGMIPDGLVLLTSISLTVGVIKMASKKVIIQKLNGIELLSCVDILCLDKTGTITDGTMKVEKVINLNKKNNIEEIISNMVKLETNITDKALINYFGKKDNLVVKEYIPFSSKKKYSEVKFESENYVLGAFEYITNNNINTYKELKEYIEKGYRILTLSKYKQKFNKESNEILGFVIIKDNIRKNAKETINYFKEQEVTIKVISGDSTETICNLLKQIDFPDCNKYINGYELPSEYEELKKIVNDYAIFGRVTPYQKQNIIKALKETKTVGMIGDGVNDILALKEADCGIALASGISAARNVSEVVLTDSDFGVLPSIVNEGRRVVNNIERVASMYLIKTIYSFLISLLCICFSQEYPFYPIQLTLISVICVGIPSFFLAIEPNYTKVKKGFLEKVFRNALPSGICVTLNVLFTTIFINILNLDYEILRMALIAATGFLNLRLIYKISIPFTILRKILLITCSLAFYLSLIILSDFLLIKEYNIITLIYCIIIIVSNSYIVDFLEEIYDKITNLIINKRSNKNEKNKIKI